MFDADAPLRDLTPQAIFQGHSHISPELGSMAFWKDYVFWLDVRTPEEKKHTSLSHTYDISLSRLPCTRLKPPKHSYIIPFSGSTFRTGVAWLWLKAMGYNRLLALPAPIEKMLIELDVSTLRQRGIPLGCCAEKRMNEYAVPLKKDNAMHKIYEVMQELDFEYLGAGKHAVTERDFLQLVNDENTFFLDVRTDEELSCSIYPWAYHIPLHELPDRIHELPKDKLIVPFCSSVFRASITWAWLKGKGFEQTKTLIIRTETIATLLKPGSLFAVSDDLDIPVSPTMQNKATLQCCAGR